MCCLESRPASHVSGFVRLLLATADINFGIMLCLIDADGSSMGLVHLCAVLRFLEGFSTIAGGKRTVTGPS